MAFLRMPVGSPSETDAMFAGTRAESPLLADWVLPRKPADRPAPCPDGTPKPPRAQSRTANTEAGVWAVCGSGLAVLGDICAPSVVGPYAAPVRRCG